MSIRRPKRRSVVYIFVLMIVAMIVLGSIAVNDLVFNEGTDRNSGRMIADISVDDQIVRIGEDVDLSAEGSKGDIKVYSWTTGNETIGNSRVINHTFNEGGWHLVVLTVEDGLGRTDTMGILMGVQRNDEMASADMMNDRDLIPGFKHGYMKEMRVAPNIGYPTVEITAEVQAVVGSVGMEVRVVNDTRSETVYDESRIVLGSSVSFSFTLETDTFFDNATRIETILWVEQGKHSGYKMTLDASYPFDKIVAPLPFDDIEATCNYDVGSKTIFNCG